MNDEQRVRQLIETMLESGETPEEVCAGFPALLPDLIAAFKQYRTVEAQLDRLFPTPNPAADPQAHRARLHTTLPRIPGYEVRDVLGRGGMGIVYRARHLQLNRIVALKMLITGDYAAAAELARFSREAEAVASLHHEQIVQVYDVGEFDGRPFFTMELLEGGTLAQALADGPMDARKAAELVVQLAHGVQVAHEHGIVHRDLKPSNILLTSTGVPKIADFGLARRVDGDSLLTLTGARLGTPSYMAPEQAVGKAGAAGPPVDVYALGAILYEVITGRPPFTSETAAETQRKLLTEEPTDPRKLNRRISRDLQTICLKSLRKDPQRRYATPTALAEDLERYLRDEPIAARPASVSERSLRWIRRHPAESGLLLASLVLAAMILRALFVASVARASLSRAVSDDLKEAAQHEAISDWAGARTAVERAAARLGSGGPPPLRARLQQADADLKLVEQLSAIVMNRAALIGGHFDIVSNRAHADVEYEKSFRDAKLGQIIEEPQAVARRVRDSQIHPALVAALDDWAVCVPDGPRQHWILAVARLSDPNSSALANELRDPAVWKDRDALKELTQSALTQGTSVQVLIALADRLTESGGDGISFLRKVQKEHPDSFWVNFALGEQLRVAKSIEAVRFFQAAIAVHPTAAVVYNNLGMTLAATGQTEEAIESFRQAVRIDADYAPAHNNLGILLRAENHSEEAAAHFRAALATREDAGTHNNLGLALVGSGKYEQAVDEYRIALRTTPDDPATHNNLGLALKALGRIDEAIAHYREAIRIDRDNFGAQNNLGIALTEVDKVDQAIEHFREALRVDPHSAAAHNNIGMGLLKKGQVDEAIAHYRDALGIDEKDPDVHNNLGLALMAKGATSEAIKEYSRAVELKPDDGPAHINLGIALRDSGRLDEAIGHFRRAVQIAPADSAAASNLAQSLQARGATQPSSRP